MNNSTRILTLIVLVLMACVMCGQNAFAQDDSVKTQSSKNDELFLGIGGPSKNEIEDEQPSLPEPEGSLPPDTKAIEPNELDRSIESLSLPNTETTDQEPDASFTPDEPTRVDSSLEEMTKILEGKSPPPNGWPTQPLHIQHQRQIFITGPGGNRQARPVWESFAIDPTKKDLSSKDRHRLYVHLIEKQIQSAHEKLLKTDDRVKRAIVLNTLKQAYVDRFRVDTAYQNLKVTEIENRAKKLREELTDRAESEENWVNAMTTLADMRANGIDPMVSMSVSQPPLTESDPRNFGRNPAAYSQPPRTMNSRSSLGGLDEDPEDPRRQETGFNLPSPDRFPLKASPFHLQIRKIDFYGLVDRHHSLVRTATQIPVHVATMRVDSHRTSTQREQWTERNLASPITATLRRRVHP